MPSTIQLAALIFALGTWSFANACPPGEVEVCLVGCLCIPNPEAINKEITRVAAPALEQWLVQSRDAAASTGTQTIPLDIKSQLQPYYDDRVLDAARYKVADGTELSAVGTMLQNPDTNAVTLIDIIVFRNADDAQSNVLLWAHELKHVQQFQDWRVAEFAVRYTRDFNTVEAPAYEIQAEVARALKASRQGL
ncbi:DUF4157 domain-containing protein [Pseudomonas sp. LS1212]|uniref:DUF4157 domain-containing protein n=1 Tax=Pseudomonas sp. LS1212 TaxID=2972478 RepID=UPI00215CA914|nr:DUF4157 domain-containing protein [Pseudomonas sp. LS1212]UVJ41881.1 DUF4157 domain-containing protein [Pseudomonas sp. LS1212]